MSDAQVHDDPQASFTLVAFLILAILVLAFVVLAQVMFYNVQSAEDQQRIVAVKPQELIDLQAQQLSRINSYRYVSEKEGIVAIPIDEAINLYAARMNRPWKPPKLPTSTSAPAQSQPAASQPATSQATGGKP